MTGELGGRALGRLGQHRGVGGVQADPLAGQQVVVDRLGEQGVPEACSRVPLARFEQVRVDGLAQCGVERIVGQIGNLGEHLVGDPPAGDRRDADDLPGVVGRVGRGGPAAGRPAATGSVSRRSHCSSAAATSSSAKNALPSARSTMRRTSRSAIGSALSDRIERADVVRPSGGEVQALDARQPGPFGDGPAQRVTPVQVVAAIADHDSYALDRAGG